MMKRVSLAKQMLAIARTSFKVQIAYRFDVICNAAAVIGRILFAWILWGVIFTGRETIGGFTYGGMLRYYAVSSFLASLDQSWGMAAEIQSRIQNGSFSKYMVIPVHLQAHFLASTGGASGYYAIFALLAAALSAAMFVPLNMPAPGIGAVILALAMIPIGLTFMISFYFMMGVFALKVQDVGLHIWGNVVEFAKGSMIPLTLLPMGVQKGLALLPFQYAAYTPAMLLTGQLTVAEGLRGLTILTAWTIAALAGGRLLYARLRLSHEGVGL